MKKTLITLLSTLTFSTIIFSQAPVQVVTDPSLLQKAIDQAIRETEKMALQEAQNRLEQMQAEAITKVSDALKNSGVLGRILNKQVKLLESAKLLNSEIGSMNLSNNVKNSARTQIKDIVKKSDEISKTSKKLMEDESLKGNDTQRLLLLNELEKQQLQCESEIYYLRRMYEQSSNFRKAINSINR